MGKAFAVHRSAFGVQRAQAILVYSIPEEVSETLLASLNAKR
jgi:hypothetical protein